MIRILHVVTYMGLGGLETMLMNYYRVIDRTQVQFDFLTHRDFEADYDAEIISLGGRIYHLPRLNPLSFRYRAALGNFFDAHPEYKIVHVHQDCLSSVVLSVAKEHGVHVRIAHSHSSSQNKDLKYPIKLFCREFIPRYATNLMSCGKAAGDWMFRGRPYTVLNNAIDAEKFRFDPRVRQEVRGELGISDSAVVIGHVGRFSPPKNHEALIDIFREIRMCMPAVLLMVGDGELRSQIEQKTTDLHLRNDVIFTGNRNDVHRLLQAMDVFVFPSVYEGVPLTLIEAQAAGLPCLISDMVPVESIITDLVQQIPLHVECSIWAEAVIRAFDLPRRDTSDKIKSSGYDVNTNAIKLVEWYKDLEGSVNE